MKKGFVVMSALTFVAVLAFTPHVPQTRAAIEDPYILYPPGIKCVLDNNGLESGSCEGSHSQDGGFGYLIAGAGARCTNPPPPPNGEIAAVEVVIGNYCTFPFYLEGFAGLDIFQDIDAVSAHTRGSALGLTTEFWMKENCRGVSYEVIGPDIPC